MNGPYPEITNISFLAKLFFKTFIGLKHLSDYRTVGLSDYRTVGLSDCRIIATAPHLVTTTNRDLFNLQVCTHNTLHNRKTNHKLILFSTV